VPVNSVQSSMSVDLMAHVCACL